MACENDDFRAFCENRDFAPTDIMQTLTDDRGRLTKPQDTPRECAPSTRQAPRSAPITCCYSSKSAVFSVFSASAEDKCHCKTVAAGFDTGCSDIPIHPVNYPKEISAIGELDISRISRLGCLAALWDGKLASFLAQEGMYTRSYPQKNAADRFLYLVVNSLYQSHRVKMSKRRPFITKPTLATPWRPNRCFDRS